MSAWTETRVVELAVPQASGVVSIDDGVFLVVDDDRGIYVAYENGTADVVARRKDHPELRDLEGICLGPDGTAWVLSERTSAVHSLSIDKTRSGVELAPPRLVAALEHIARKNNKGWEGIEVFGAHAFACHEDKPKRVGVFSLPDLVTVAVMKLPKSADSALDDLSDVCIDPLSGHLIVLSDESACFAELSLEVDHGVPTALALERIVEIDVGKKEKPEGVCVDGRGALWLVTDGDPHLRAFERR